MELTFKSYVLWALNVMATDMKGKVMAFLF